MTLAWQSGGIPVIILNKADLADDYTAQVRAAEKVAANAGVYVISVKTGFGTDALGEYLKPRKTIVFLGSSGVGKSSLVNALAGKKIMAVNEIRESDSRGRHTTAHRQLIMLGSGAMIIDTPGMRELGMWDVSKGLGEAFDDVEHHLGLCRFSDCRHQTEPGCAVRDAIARGELSRERWESYLKLKHEARYAGDKAGYLKEKKRWEKDIAKYQKQSRATRQIIGIVTVWIIGMMAVRNIEVQAARITGIRPALRASPARLAEHSWFRGRRQPAPQPLPEVPVQCTC